MCFLTFGMRFMFFSYMFKCVLDIMYFFVFSDMFLTFLLSHIFIHVSSLFMYFSSVFLDSLDIFHIYIYIYIYIFMFMYVLTVSCIFISFHAFLCCCWHSICL
jgi:hypothetical protein